VWLGLCKVELVPSPKSQAKAYGGWPPVADPVRVAVNGASPIAGVALTAAASGPMELMVRAVALTLAPLASVTVKLAVYVPEA
jgi:hypothetical protein